MTDYTDLSQIAYSVQEQGNRFTVCSAWGRAILACNDLASASHYASLLNEAFNAGYKSGFHAARNDRDR